MTDRHRNLTEALRNHRLRLAQCNWQWACSQVLSLCLTMAEQSSHSCRGYLVSLTQAGCESCIDMLRTTPDRIVRMPPPRWDCSVCRCWKRVSPAAGPSFSVCTAASPFRLAHYFSYHPTSVSNTSILHFPQTGNPGVRVCSPLGASSPVSPPLLALRGSAPPLRRLRSRAPEAFGSNYPLCPIFLPYWLSFSHLLITHSRVPSLHGASCLDSVRT